MRVSVAAVGRMKAGPERQLVDRYFERLSKAGPAVGIDYHGLSEFAESRLSTSLERKREEARRLEAAVPEGASLWLFDERGKTLSSEEFAKALGLLRDAGQRDLGILVGGPDGHDEALRSRASRVVSLGRMTFPHQIARILVAEQLYRAATILAGHPYHRS